MPVGEQHHRVVACAVVRTFLGSAEQRSDFVAGEAIAQARFAGHAYNSPRPPSPSSQGAEPRVNAFDITKRLIARVALRLFMETCFQAATRTKWHKGLRISALTLFRIQV